MLDSGLKQRMVGALVLVALAVIFLPMLLSREDEMRRVVVDAPAMPQAPAAAEIIVQPAEVVEPEVIEPEVTEPEVIEPEVVEPEVVIPEVAESDVAETHLAETADEGATGPRAKPGATGCSARQHRATRRFHVLLRGAACLPHLGVRGDRHGY